MFPVRIPLLLGRKQATVLRCQDKAGDSLTDPQISQGYLEDFGSAMLVRTRNRIEQAATGGEQLVALAAGLLLVKRYLLNRTSPRDRSASGAGNLGTRQRFLAREFYRCRQETECSLNNRLKQSRGAFVRSARYKENS